MEKKTDIYMFKEPWKSNNINVNVTNSIGVINNKYL